MEQQSYRKACPQLPLELLTEIFNHLPGSKSLLRCRLVCRSWKEAVDSSPKLMRKLTVAVHHPSLFLDLNKFAHRVKTIRLRQALPPSKEELDNFFMCIGPTVEKVVFDFMLRFNEFFNLAHGKNLVTQVFLRCKALNEIEIVQSRFQLACGLDKLDDEIFQVASAKVKAITTDWFPRQDKCQNNVLETFLLRLGNLSTIRFASYPSREIQSRLETPRLQIAAFQFITKYMDKYPGILKRIYLPDGIFGDGKFILQFYSEADTSEHLSVIFRASSQDIAINDRNLRCNLSNIVEYEATEELRLDTPKYFSNFSAGKLIVNLGTELELPEGYHRFALFTNIRELVLGIFGTYNPSNHRADLQYLNYMHGVERLSVYSCPQVHISSVISIGNDQILWNWASYTSSLKQLAIKNHRFETLSEVEGIVSTFPHLTHITFQSIEGVDPNFVVLLTKLEKLENIVLALIEDLTDEAFTLPCEVETDSQQHGQRKYVPAIGAFKSLKGLHLNQCRSLTDSCLIEGISKARSLQSVEVFMCTGITTVGFNSLLEHMEETRDATWRSLRIFRRAIRKVVAYVA